MYSIIGGEATVAAELQKLCAAVMRARTSAVCASAKRSSIVVSEKEESPERRVGIEEKTSFRNVAYLIFIDAS